MPIEAIVGLQLGLYGLGWLLAAALIAEERRVLLHWAAYAMLQSLSAFWAVDALAHGQHPPVASLLGSALGFVAAMRGVDIFAAGRPQMDRWLLPLTLLIVSLLVGAEQALPEGAQRLRLQGLVYGLGLSVLLLCSSLLLWPRLRKGVGRLATAAALAPSFITGLLGLVSAVLRLSLGAQEMDEVQHAARMPNMVASLVASAIFNFGFMFLFLARVLGVLRHSARHDHLTGALNRREIEAVLGRAWSQHQRSHTGLAVALIDVDHFKRINDAHGHARGDEVLAFVARLLGEHTRSHERVGRWGGEEFLLVMPASDAAQANQTCERLRLLLGAASLEATGLPVTISVGVAVVGPVDREPADLVQRADRAMYLAKAAGRDRVTMAGALRVVQA